MGNESDQHLNAFFGFVQAYEALHANIGYETGAAIRMARENMNVSQTALAHSLGVSQPYLSQVERGAKTVSPTQLTRIYNALASAQRGDSTGE